MKDGLRHRIEDIKGKINKINRTNIRENINTSGNPIGR